MTKKRRRPIHLHVMVSETEQALIQERMAEAGIRNMGAYMRKMALSGYEPTPQELLERMELFIRLWNALNSLPEIQGRRIDAHIILGKSIKEIAEAEGVHEESVRQSIKRGLERMKKTF